MVVIPNIRRKYMVGRVPRGVPIPMSSCVVMLASDSVTYTGSARTVGVTVTFDGATLAVNTDYTLSYSNNVNLGPATVTVTGMGQFTGSVTKTFYVVRSGGQDSAWTFDLSKTSDPEKSASLADGNSALVPYHLQAVNDAMVFFVDKSSRRMYLWGFDDGHEYDVGHVSQSYMSRSDVLSHCLFGEIASNGGVAVYSADTYGYIWHRPLQTEFDLTSLGSESTSIGSYVNSRICLPKGGGRLVRKVYNSSDFYVYDCASAFDYSSLSQSSLYNFSNYGADVKSKADLSSGSLTWKDFQVSGDGKVIVASVTVGSVEVVARIDFEIAWELGSGSVSSAFVVPSGVSGVQAVMIDPQGSKMFLFSTGDGKLHEYSLSA